MEYYKKRKGNASLLTKGGKTSKGGRGNFPQVMQQEGKGKTVLSGGKRVRDF